MYAWLKLAVPGLREMYPEEFTPFVSRFGLAVKRRLAGKQKDLGSIPLRFSFLVRKVVVCGHCLVTLSLTVNETLK